MKVINQSQYPDSEVGTIIHNLESGTASGMVALVTDTHSVYRGLYRSNHWYARTRSGLKPINFLLRIGGPDKFPCTDVRYPGINGPSFTFVNWREAFLVLVAHELEHHNQYRRKRRKMDKFYPNHTIAETNEYRKKHNWYSEIKAERKAAKVLENWRSNPRLQEILYPTNLHDVLAKYNRDVNIEGSPITLQEKTDVRNI